MYVKIGLFISVCSLWGMSSCSLRESDSEICFVGDSITYLWDLEYHFPGYYIHKHAVSGAVVQNIDNWNLADCYGLPIVFLMGINNIGERSVLDEYAEEKRQQFNEIFFQRVEPLGGEPLWIVSILPRGNRENQKEINQNIELQNALIKRSLDSLGNAYGFIDVFDYFLKDDYRIDSTLFNDGLHPNERGYEILTSKVQERL